MIRERFSRHDIIGFSKMRRMILNIKEHMYDLFPIGLLMSTGGEQ